MPMQRKRPREHSQRFYYRYLEMFDMINNVQIILAICAVFLLVGMRQRRGMAVFDVIVVVLLLCLARVLYDEALKRPVSARPKEGIKYLLFTDFNTERRKQYFYRRFRFRENHFEQFMIAVDLLDATGEFKKFLLDRHRHYVYVVPAIDDCADCRFSTSEGRS